MPVDLRVYGIVDPEHTGGRSLAELAHQEAGDRLVWTLLGHHDAGALDELIRAQRSGEGEPVAAAHHIGAGAIVLARVPRVVYGTTDPKAGAAGSVLDVLAEPRFNHRPEVAGGVLQVECAARRLEFVAARRDNSV